MPKECKHPTCGDKCRREKKSSRGKTGRKSNGEPDQASLMNDLITVFHKYIRLRDQHKGCISCCFGTVVHAGHYYPAGKFSGVRFDEMNVNGQCEWCNTAMQGNLEDYYVGLVNEYTAEEVLKLEERAERTKLYKWSRTELIEKIEYYNQKIEELLKPKPAESNETVQ